MNYTKGLHLIADIHTSNSDVLIAGNKFMQDVLQEINSLELNIVGSVIHHFETGGFTISICLTESHVCVHTWPEFGYVTLDIYLSNNYKVNDKKGRTLLQFCESFFQSSSTKLHELYR